MTSKAQSLGLDEDKLFELVLDRGLQRWHRVLVVDASDELVKKLDDYLDSGQIHVIVRQGEAFSYTNVPKTEIGEYDRNNGLIVGVGGAFDVIVCSNLGEDVNRSYLNRRLYHLVKQLADQGWLMVGKVSLDELSGRFEELGIEAVPVCEWEDYILEDLWWVRKIPVMILPQHIEYGLWNKQCLFHSVVRNGKKQVQWRSVLRKARSISDHFSMTEKQQKRLYEVAMKLPKKAIIVELGIAYGKTGAILAQVAYGRHLYYHAVDNFSLVGHSKEFAQNFDRLGLPYVLHVGGTDRVEWNEGLIDLLIVDAGHDADHVLRDVERWVPKVRAGGYVAFHDYDADEVKQSPHWAVKKGADETTGDWEYIDYIEGLMIRRRPKK